MTLIVCFFVWGTAGIAADIATPLERAHAHNDYLHERPLLDALDHGFNSVEADIFLVGDRLLVAHDFDKIAPQRTLETLYLDPLRRRAQKNGGRIHSGAAPFRLLIDIKSDARATYAALAKRLASYADLVAHFDNGRFEPGAVEVVISGNRAKDLIAGDSPRYAGIDGRLRDLGGETPTHLMPLISDNWKSHFRWNGKGAIPAEEEERLRQFVQRTHQEGRQIRFWGTPDTSAMWKVLDDSGVDAINTDDLAGLASYLAGRPARSK
ncbi:hypothetical protein FYK55_06285 [Roseiconus nitratireducens]|uniref:Altered inheritance of mitochondria protein 6 n=1 Tax=Roseiconus nitratireducens TaxID=2605748 RepID=A0A5M6DDW7_9BACT|nr:hypothetical protein FYK55_06285 [Roseiconus nitratireducens]